CCGEIFILTAVINLIFLIIFDYTPPEKFVALMLTPRLFSARAEGALYLILAKQLIKSELVQK
ncbi:hypothetical protein L0Z72_10770, partial [candidate division KSB1 bacterium]|nr:hypothetical protein [candidate division KSB1 bacterium]